MSTRCSLFLTKDGEHWYHDVSDYSFNIQIDRRNVVEDESDKDDIVLSIREGSNLWDCLMRMMAYRREFDKITND